MRFITSDFKSAKAPLRESVRVPPHQIRKSRRTLSDTLVTSCVQSQEVKYQSRPRMMRIMTCHGWQLVMEGSEHNRYAIGKDKCTLPHSDRCLGGIPESDSWRSCPSDFVGNVGYDGTGFSQTCGVADFQSAEASTPVGAESHCYSFLTC